MSKPIVLDDELRSKLNGLNETVEVCDLTGRTVGQFVPQDEYVRLLYAWAQAQVSEAELNQASRQPGGRKLTEIWRRLGRS